MSYFEQGHRTRIDSSAAYITELLPKPDEEVAEVRAEYRDAFLCGDSALIERTDREVELRENVHARLAALWMLMNCAQDSRDEALSEATAAEIKATARQEFGRRNKL